MSTTDKATAALPELRKTLEARRAHVEKHPDQALALEPRNDLLALGIEALEAILHLTYMEGDLPAQEA